MSKETIDGAPTASYTGRKRRTTRKSVKIIDAIATWVICAGGIGVTIAFAGIVLFILSVTLPLFRGAKLTALSSASINKVDKDQANVPEKPLAMGLDENLASLWMLDSQANLRVYNTADGQCARTFQLSKQAVTAVSNNQSDIAIGLVDGTVRMGRIRNTLKYLDQKNIPENMKALPVGRTAVFDEGVAAISATNQLRIVKTIAELSEPVKIGDGSSPVRKVDYLFTDDKEDLTAIREDGKLYFATITKKENVMTGKIARSANSYELPVPEDYRKRQPAALLIGLNGRIVFLVYEDGKLLRYNTDDPAHSKVIEAVDLLSAGEKITSVRMLLGNLTLIVSDNNGGVNGWFPAPVDRDRKSEDGLQMVKAHVHEKQPSSVTATAASSRDRQFVTCDGLGNLFVRHMTSGTTQGKVKIEASSPIVLVAMSPKNDAIAAVDENLKLTLFNLDNPHADGSMAQLFRPIWYEGYSKPDYVYQSSAGTDDAEAKFSLIPLIFGTLKATFYALVLGVPIAILAAIYTSEFMDANVRTIVKPAIETMASLPSVVLGFIAALILAPIVEQAIVATLIFFIAIPLSMMTFGFVWQAVPARFTRVISGFNKLGILLLLVIASFIISVLIGPVVEWALFENDFRGWLSGRVGTATPGWIVLLTPLFVLILAITCNQLITPRSTPGRSPIQQCLAQGLRYLGVLAAAICLALLAAWFFKYLGWDLRGSLVGGYVQRNTLIVGIVMGFAIIPIVYTVSEDAISSVPDSLRAGAFGLGATQWQSAIGVVLPVAASGIFSACMIGLGRAAGETMIVLMASGRTPIIDLNVFNGLSALSANIATELPEAPVNSTHYRVLFMSALVLFMLTFVVNTTAEVIRIRFRRRASQL